MPPGRVFARLERVVEAFEMRNTNLSTTLLDRRRIVFNQRFEWIAAAVLLGNSMLVGIEAEFTLNNLNSVPRSKLILFIHLRQLLKPVLETCKMMNIPTCT